MASPAGWLAAESDPIFGVSMAKGGIGMTFTWEPGKQGVKGKGTLQEYLTWEPDVPKFEGEDQQLEEMYTERNRAISRLELELFAKAGCRCDDVISYDYQGEEWDGGKDYQFSPGWTLIEGDDEIFGLYKDGKPTAAFYAACRGPSFLAGGYIVKTNKHYWDSFCSEVSEEFLFPELDDQDEEN